MILVEIEMLNQFVNQLAMCELLSAHSLLQPSMAFDCMQVENFIKESYFDNNYQAFIAWWDSNVVPITEEFNTLYQETRNESM
tara:strand:- start:113 stop:361 length:249 start_codon:yes stop_codon:yes gene_type:complete